MDLNMYVIICIMYGIDRKCKFGRGYNDVVFGF